MKKKIFVIFLTVCFFSAPLSAKAMMLDSMPKVNDNVEMNKFSKLVETITAYQQGEIESSDEDGDYFWELLWNLLVWLDENVGPELTTIILIFVVTPIALEYIKCCL